MELWDQDFVDAEESGYISFDGRGGEFHFGYVHGAFRELEFILDDKRTRVAWSWEGNDEHHEAHGRGVARILPDGTLRGKIAFAGGDRSAFTAVRWAEPVK